MSLHVGVQFMSTKPNVTLRYAACETKPSDTRERTRKHNIKEQKMAHICMLYASFKL